MIWKIMKYLTKEEILALPDFSLFCHNVRTNLVFMVHREHGGEVPSHIEGLPCIQIEESENLRNCWLSANSNDVILLYSPNEEPQFVGEPHCKCLSPSNHNSNCLWLAWRRG